jgi:Tol biopolymer transport system component
MKPVLLLLLLICSSQIYGQGKSFDYCYQNKTGICVYSIADKKEQVIVKQGGTDPCISPDGRKVAYTINSKNDVRTIGMIDLSSKQKTTLKTNSRNCFAPVWSPDGKYIAYSVFDKAKSKWSVAVIDAANTTFKVISGDLDCNRPTWSTDSKNIVVQNMSSLFVMDMAAKVIATYQLSDLAKESSPTSADRYIFTPDKKIVFSSEVDMVSDSDVPPSAIYVYDIVNKQYKKITPKEYFPYDITVKNSKVFFSATKYKSSISNIYMIDMDGKNLKLLFRNSSYFTAKN